MNVTDEQIHEKALRVLRWSIDEARERGAFWGEIEDLFIEADAEWDEPVALGIYRRINSVLDDFALRAAK